VNPNIPSIAQDEAISPHALEIEYALILSRLIDGVKEDPARMRATVYEYARARLKVDSSIADEGERKRLLSALETAIKGVEAFSVRHDGTERPAIALSPAPTLQIALAGPSADGPSARSMTATVHPVTPADGDILPPERSQQELRIVLEQRPAALASMLLRFSVGMLLFVLVVTLAYNKQSLPEWRDRLTAVLTGADDVKPATADPGGAVASADTRPAAAPQPGKPPFPLPSDYGIYVLSNGALSELTALSTQVPDKRIAVSTPVNEPSLTTLPDGKARFILFRRDLVGNAPDRIEVRVVARVVRALTFDAKGKPQLLPVTDTWSIRNVSYEFRVRPVPGNPEMLLVQPEKADFTLAPGRYVLVLRGQGYDFTVGGNVTELAQCLERTDAANGAFYSECQKP
jgi:hypothetical protein